MPLQYSDNFPWAQSVDGSGGAEAGVGGLSVFPLIQQVVEVERQTQFLHPPDEGGIGQDGAEGGGCLNLVVVMDGGDREVELMDGFRQGEALLPGE